MIFVGKNLATDLPISLGLTLFISIIEVLVAFLQAFIFLLDIIYLLTSRSYDF